MKNIVMVVVGLAMVVLISGCATEGGMKYIGPISYMHAQSADKTMMKRSVVMSRLIPAEKKDQIFKVVNMGAGPNQVAVGIGVDVCALTEGGYTTGEKWMQFGSAVVDTLLYGAVGYGAQQALTSNDSSTKNVTVNNYNIVNNGSGNNNNINSGAGQQSNNSSSSSGVTGDGSETANQ